MKAIAFLAGLLALLTASPAGAAPIYDPVGGGATTLKLDPSFRSLLAENGVRLAAKGGARISGARVTFPVSGGRFDPVEARGVVDHAGSLVLSAGRRKLPLRALVFKPTQASSPLSAKFGGGQLKLASSALLTTGRAGFGLRADVRRMELSAKVATRLGKKLRLRGVFHEGQALGNSVTVVQPASAAILPSGRATLVPDPAFLAKLNGLFVSLNPISPAELGPGPQVSFPIAAGGSLAPDASAGTLKLGGAVEFLQLGGGQIFWAEPVLDLGTGLAGAEVDFQPSPPYPGKLGPVAVLGLGVPASIGSEPAPRRISVGGQPVALTAATAAAFNEAFAKPQGKSAVFTPGEPVGALAFTAQAQ